MRQVTPGKKSGTARSHSFPRDIAHCIAHCIALCIAHGWQALWPSGPSPTLLHPPRPFQSIRSLEAHLHLLAKSSLQDVQNIPLNIFLGGWGWGGKRGQRFDDDDTDFSDDELGAAFQGVCALCPC